MSPSSLTVNSLLAAQWSEPMTARPKQIFPGYAMSFCIARTLAARDPGFLAALRTNVFEMLKTEPRDGMTYETLSTFLAAMDEPSIFPRR
jgi:hypothetical protein